MKLTLIASLLLTSSAHAALFPADHPSHLGELTKDIIKFKKLGQALPLANSAPSSGIRSALTRARTSNRRHLEDPCVDETSEELEGALDIARAATATYEDIVCIKDENTATQKCTWDFTDAITDGVLNDAVAICASNNDGVVFTFDAEISCDDGSSFSMIASPFTCFSNCYDYDPVVTYVTSVLPASTFVGKNETDNCNWDAFSMDPIAVEEGSTSEYYDDGTDDSPFGDGVCVPIDLEDEFASLFGEYMDPFITCLEENDPPHNCHLDFTQPFNNGEFDALPALCEGEIYILSYNLSYTEDCPGDYYGGIIKYSYIPFCFDNCSVDLLTTFFAEGISAGDDCTFVDVGEVFMYSSGGNDGDDDSSKSTCSPKKTHVSLLLCFFAMIYITFIP